MFYEKLKQNLMLSLLLLISSSLVITAFYEKPIISQAKTMGQNLPISGKAIIKGETIELEIARTPKEQAMGLMYRPALPPNRGMLFPFNPPDRVGFWMKNVPVPLDMVFLYQGKVKKIWSKVPPCKQDPCPSYDSTHPVDMVLELRSGRATELELKEGDEITIKFL